MAYYDTPDHPTIRNLLRTGEPDGQYHRPPICPVCGEECDTLYLQGKAGEVVGCDMCIRSVDAWECEEAYSP